MADQPKNVVSTSRSSSEESVAEKRRTLKALLYGAGAVAGAQAIPEKWTKPAISSVILPAHAAATKIQSFECSGGEFGFSFSAEGNEVTLTAESIRTEADAGTPVNFELTGEGEISPFVETMGTVNAEGFVDGVELGPFAEAEATGGEAEVNWDIGDDGVVDCNFETTIPLE